MIKKLTFAVLLSLSSLGYAQKSETEQPTGTVQTYAIADDGYANVPLQFSFPYYGQTFTNSWMFSNGIITFKDPELSGLSGMNLATRPINGSMGSQFDYSIFPLWTDLINLSGTFQTQSSTQFQRYSWIGISPFYDATRLNTFSVELKPDGQIIANYSLINANYATVGMTGNTSKGEYEQIGYFTGPVTTGMISDWTRKTIDPCADNALSSPTCPGFSDALSKITVSPATETVVVQQMPMVESAPAQTTTSTVVDSSNQQNEKPSGPTLSSILSTIRSNEQRQLSIAMAAIASANQVAMSTVEQADKIALTSASASSSASSVATSESAGSSVRFNSSIYSLRPDVRLGNDITNNELSLTSEIKPIMLRLPSIEMFSGNQLTDNISNSNIIFGKKGDPIQDYIEANNQFFTENKVETRQTTVRQNVQDNDLAGANRIERMAVVPNGFNVYTQFMLTNIAFYEPKEIYKNVVIKDNVRTMYFIEKSNTDTYNKMVGEQYK